jgi:N6-L-threonylcarbamoyladenine synthase
MFLAVETSCDETSAAVVHDGRVLSNVVSSQVALHAEYGGVVPELATREHLRAWLPVVRAALSEAKTTAAQLTAVAATRGPGLPNALLVGLKGAAALAYALQRPLFAVHHHEAHLYSPWIQEGRARWDLLEPNVSLIVSGGHTLLVHVRGPVDHVVLGGTLDDAAGECFDKVAKLLGLAYPGGPELDRLAEEGDARAYAFPRPLLGDAGDNFSFAGLKTSVRYFLQKNPELLRQKQGLVNVCASVRAAIVEVLVTKTIRAALRLNVKCVTASGGVTCNKLLRAELERAAQTAGLRLRLADRTWCTDNAGMIGVLAEYKAQHGFAPSALDVEPDPGWALS